MHAQTKKHLGELVIAFAALEDTLCEGLAQLLRLEYADSKIIFSAISFNKKVQILNAFLQKYYGANSDHLIYELLAKANNLEALRNKFIHSDWEFFHIADDDRVGLRRGKLKYKRKTSAQFQIEKMGSKEVEQLKDIIKDITECAEYLFREFGEVGNNIEKRLYEKA
jgi:hypothetical protein